MRTLCICMLLLGFILSNFPHKVLARDKNRVPLPWERKFSIGANNKDTSYIRKATRRCQAADDFMAKGKYDLAVVEYKAAATINPDRDRYKKLHKEAIKTAQEFHLKRAAQAEKERDLYIARDSYAAVSKHRPNLVARTKRKQVLASIKSLEEAFGKVNFESAEIGYRQVLELLAKWPTNQTFAKKLEELRKRLFDGELRRANTLLNTNFKWSQAHQIVKNLMERAPGYPEAQRIADEAERRMRAHSSFLGGRKLAQAGKWKKAVVQFQECLGHFSQYPKGKQQLDKAISAVSSRILSQAKKAEMMGDWRSVATAYAELLTYRPDSLKYQTKLRESKTKWAKILLADGDRLIKKDYFGMGFIYHLLAMSQDSSLYDLQHGLKVLTNRIRQRIQKRVYVKSFVNNTKSPHVGGLLASMLSQYITNGAPGTVTLIESSQGHNVLMTGLVTNCFVDTKKQANSKTIRYQVGMRLVPNPAYQQLLMQLQRAQSDVVTATGIAQTDAQYRYERLQRQLNSTPPQIQQPDYAMASHPVYTWTMTARLSLLFKIINSQSGRIIAQKQITESSQASDQTIQADPEKGVVEDPLELPDDEVMIRQLIDKAAKKVEDVARTYFKSIERIHLRKGDDLASKNKRKAVEEYVNHIFAAQDKASIDERVFSYIAKACELPAHITLRKFVIDQVNK